MPSFLSSLLGGLVSIAGSLAGRVFLALGFGFVTLTGVSSGLDSIKTLVMSALAGSPSQIITIMSLLNVDKAISIVFGAVAARLLLTGLGSDLIKRMVLK